MNALNQPQKKLSVVPQIKTSNRSQIEKFFKKRFPMSSLLIMYDGGKFKSKSMGENVGILQMSIFELYAKKESIWESSRRKNWLKFYFKITFTYSNLALRKLSIFKENDKKKCYSYIATMCVTYL